MRCAKCHKNQGTILFTPVVGGKAQKTVHLCEGCASTRTGFHIKEPKTPEVFRHCRFCGRRARFADLCKNCGTELRDIMFDLAAAETPRLFKREPAGGTVIFLPRTPEAAAWSVGASLRATKILLDRRRQLPVWKRWAARIARLCP